MKSLIAAIVLLLGLLLVYFFQTSSEQDLVPSPEPIAQPQPRVPKITDVSDDRFLRAEIEPFFNHLEGVGVPVDSLSIEAMIESLERTIGLDLASLDPEQASEFRSNLHELVTRARAQGWLGLHQTKAGRMQQIQRLENGDLIVSYLYSEPLLPIEFETRWWIRYKYQWKIYDKSNSLQDRLSISLAALVNQKMSAPIRDLPPTILFPIERQHIGESRNRNAVCQAAEKVLASDPKPGLRSFVSDRYARALSALGKHDEALPYFDSAMQTPEFRRGALLDSARCLRRIEKFDQAIERANQYIEQVGPMTSAYEELARNHLAAGDTAPAYENAMLGLQLEPSSIKLLALAFESTHPEQQDRLLPALAEYARAMLEHLPDEDLKGIEFAYAELLSHAIITKEISLFDRAFSLLEKTLPESELVPEFKDVRHLTWPKPKTNRMGCS